MMKSTMSKTAVPRSSSRIRGAFVGLLVSVVLLLDRPHGSVGFSSSSLPSRQRRRRRRVAVTTETTSVPSRRTRSRLFISNSNSNSNNSGDSNSGRPTSTPPAPSSPPPQQQQQQQSLQRRRRSSALQPLFSSTVTEKSSFETPSSSSTTLKTLRSAANWASLLCVLDCTILPLLTVLLPLVGWMNIPVFGMNSVAFQQSLCVWSHNLALFFVLPVGTTTTALNYATGHRNPKVAAMGLLGLLAIGLANAGGGDWCWIEGWVSSSHSTTSSSSSLLLMLVAPLVNSIVAVLSALHHGLWHRLVNLAGCALLLGSNYISQQLGCDCGIPFCQPKSSNSSGGTTTNANPLLQVRSQEPSSSSSLSSPSKVIIPSSAMSMQTRMIQHKNQQKQLLLQKEQQLEPARVSSAGDSTTHK